MSHSLTGSEISRIKIFEHKNRWTVYNWIVWKLALLEIHGRQTFKGLGAGIHGRPKRYDFFKADAGIHEWLNQLEFKMRFTDGQISSNFKKGSHGRPNWSIFLKENVGIHERPNQSEFEKGKQVSTDGRIGLNFLDSKIIVG